MNSNEPRVITRLPINKIFAQPSDGSALEKAAAALEAHQIEVRIVDDGPAAREAVLTFIAPGDEIGQGASMTMDEIGITELVEQSGKYEALRPRLRAMDRATQSREIRKLGAAPDVWLNSVNALTEAGELVMASATGSQLGPMAYAAGRLILVIGAQKIVPDLTTALQRIREYCYPLEDVTMQEKYGLRSSINKILIIDGESRPGRTTVILVRQPLGR
jgi:hypothetical protein